MYYVEIYPGFNASSLSVELLTGAKKEVRVTKIGLFRSTIGLRFFAFSCSTPTMTFSNVSKRAIGFHGASASLRCTESGPYDAFRNQRRKEEGQQ